MDFHGMKRKNLQILCKKHGIPGNLKNVEMACRLASLFKKETTIEKEITPEPIKDDLVVCREAKKVKFSPQNEVFEFTRSVKKCQRRNARTCRERPAQGEIALRRSKRSVLNNNKEEEIVKDSEKEVSVDFKVQEARKCNRGNVLDAPKVEKVLRRSKRLVNNSKVELNTHEDFKIKKDQSIKITTDFAKPCIRGGTAESPLCPSKDGKEERKVKKSKGFGAANSTEGEPGKDNRKEPSIDCKVQKIEKYLNMKVQDVEKVPRRSKRLGNNVHVPTDKQPVVGENSNAVKCDDLEKSDSSQGGAIGIRASELLVDDEAQKSDNQLKKSSGNDPVGAAVDNTQDQAMANLSKKCSARGGERDRASVDSMDTSEVNDEMIVPVRFTRNSSRQNSKNAPVVVEGNMVEKKDQTLDSLVKSPKRVTRRMKRGRPVDSSMNKDTVSIQRNLTTEKFLVVNDKLEPRDAGISNVTELGGTNVEARSSSKKTKTVNQELVKDIQQGIVEGSFFSSETKAIEHVMVAENVLDSSPRKSVDSSKKTNTQELSSDLLEEEREGKHEQDTVFMVPLKKDKEEGSSLSAALIERSSFKNDGLQSEVKIFSAHGSSDGYLVVETTPLPTPVPLAVNDPEVELSVPTGDIFDDNASLAIAEEDIRPKEETVISTHRSELNEHSSVSKLAEAEAALENAVECGKEFYSNIYHEEGSLEKNIQAANLHGNFSEYDTVNISSEEQAEISKVGFETMTVSITSTLEEQEIVKDKLQGMIEELSSSETKAIEPLMIAENELGSTPKISADISQRRNTQELSSDLMEEELESNQEHVTISMTTTNKDREEASSLSEVPIERSSEPSPPFASVQLTVSKHEAELRKPTGHIVEDNTLTVTAEEDIRTKADTLISTPRSELKENSSVSKLETEAKLETPAEYGKGILLSKDNEQVSLEKEIQAANLHGNFTEYNSENINAEKAAEITKVDCDTNDGNISFQAMLMRITSSLEEQTVSEQKETEMMSPNKLNDDVETGSVSKGKSLLVKPNLPNMDRDSVFVEEVCMESVSNVGTAQTAKNVGKTGLILPICKGTEYSMEKTPVSISKHHSCTEAKLYEREEIDLHGDKSNDMTKNVVLLSTSITRSEEESRSSCGEDNLNLKYFDNLTGGKKKASSCEVRHCEKLESPVEPKDSSLVTSEPHDELIIVEPRDELIRNVCSYVRQSSVRDFEGDVGGRCEENKNVEFHCESSICSSLDKHILLRNSASHGAENSGGNEALEFSEKSVISSGMERHEFYGYFGQDKAREDEENKVARCYEEPELREAGCLADKSSDKSSLLTSPERQLMYGASLQKETRKTIEKADAEFLHESAIPNIPESDTLPEDSELNEAAKMDEVTKSEENKVVEVHVDCSIITSDDKHLASETNERVKRDNITAKSHDESDIFTTTKSRSLIGDSELDEAENYRENKDVELLGESNTFTAATCEERRGFLENSEQHNSGKKEENKVEFKDESANFTRLETCLLLGEQLGQDRLDIGKSDIKQYQNHCASSPIVTLKNDRVAPESCVAVRDNTTNDSYDRTTLKVSYSHEFNAGQESAGKPKDHQENDLVSLHATVETLKKSKTHSLHVETVNRLDFDIAGTETIMEAGRNDSCNSNEELKSKECEPLTMEHDTSKIETIGLTVGEFSSHREVSGASCSLVSEESAPYEAIQNQINNAPEELPIAETKGIGELIKATVTNNTREGTSGKNRDHEGDLQLFTSGDTSVFGETRVSPRKDGLNLGFNRREDFESTCQESGCKLPEDEATGTIASAFALQSETRGQSTFQSNKNEKGEEMVPEETLNEISYGTGTPSSQRQAIRQPDMIHRTQVKPKRHDMKENAQSSKIMQNLNVTAPRTSKRQPLQDLRKIN